MNPARSEKTEKRSGEGRGRKGNYGGVVGDALKREVRSEDKAERSGRRGKKKRDILLIRGLAGYA